MRIAYVTETYPPELNGVSLTVQRTEAFLRRSGCDVELIRPRQHNEMPREDDDVWLTRGMAIPMYPDLRFGMPAKRKLMTRWQRNPPHLVHVATEGPLGWSAVQAARRLGIATTSDFRTNFHHYSRYYRLGWTEGLVTRYLRSFHNATLRTFVPTVEMREMLAGEGFENLEVVGRGVDTHLFNPQRRSALLRDMWGVDDASPVLLYVGRLAAEKNVDLVFEAMQRAKERSPDAKLVIVGDGPLRAKLESCYRDAIFMGRRQDEDLAEIYASADIFLFPSRTDTFGNVVLEAMASGLLVVAYDTGAAREHLYTQISGLVALHNEQSFVSAVCILARYLSRYRPLRERARSLALEAQWDEVLGKFRDRLEEVVEHAGRRAAEHDAAAFSASGVSKETLGGPAFP